MWAGLDRKLLERTTFDDRTRFPDDERGKELQEEAKKILADGEFSQSLGYLHSKEITESGGRNAETVKLDGSGVNIAFIDQGFDKDMSEFEGRVIHHMTCRQNKTTGEYVVVEYTGERAGHDNFHGNTAADLAAGKKCGIAPKADIYFFEVDSRGEEGEYDKRVEAILKYIEANIGELKLDIISHSAGASKSALDIVDRIREVYGCEYINSQIFWKDFFPGREIDGEIVEAGFVKSVRMIARIVPEIYEEKHGQFLTNNEAIVIPVEGRTSIQVLRDENENIIRDEEGKVIESRKFNGAICGASFAIPQLVGYFALARQMNPKMSFKNFVNKVREYAKVNSNGQLFIKPIEVIERMWEELRTQEMVSTKKLGQETLAEQNDTAYIDETEQVIGADERAIESENNAQSL